VLLTYARHSQLTSIVITLLAREASTAEDLSAQLRGAIAPCVAGVISGKPADTADFKGAFDFYSTKLWPGAVVLVICALTVAILHGPLT